jgi:broad specificity phosphatase PhoE
MTGMTTYRRWSHAIVLTLFAALGLAAAQPIAQTRVGSPPSARLAGPAAPELEDTRAASRVVSSPVARNTLRIYIARHGETASNAERRVLGQIDQPLNERGLAQAESLRRLLDGVPLDAIYTSPLARALITAGTVANGRPIRALPDLMERNQGRFQGLLADTQPDFVSRMTNPADDLDGGETTFQLDARARRALALVRRATPRGSVLIVAHFLTNQMLLRELLGVSVEDAMKITQANDELYMVELSPGVAARTWKLITSDHLGEL